MERLRSDDAEIVYDIVGNGPPVVLLHPFPVHHKFWNRIVPMLSSRYRLILPDLRGHGDSEIGQGPATMGKHARDLAHLLDAVGEAKAAFVGVSIGGYILFEFWRQFRGRVNALVLCDTKPQADASEARANRLKSASDVLEQGTDPFVESMIPKVLGRTTLSARPDLLDGARQMMSKMSPEDVSLVQRGMAERPDSVADLKTINVPTLIVIGEEDILATPADGELMRQHISGSQLKIIPKAGHYAPWEQPEAVGPLLRQSMDAIGTAN
jgi:pimeloyl-ACP methyl ester carboxylesterase